MTANTDALRAHMRDVAEKMWRAGAEEYKRRTGIDSGEPEEDDLAAMQAAYLAAPGADRAGGVDDALLRWVKAQADDPDANPRFRELYATLAALPPTPPAGARIPEGQPLNEVAESIGVSPAAVIRFLFCSGIMATLTQKLDYTTIGLIEQHFKEKADASAYDGVCPDCNNLDCNCDSVPNGASSAGQEAALVQKMAARLLEGIGRKLRAELSESERAALVTAQNALASAAPAGREVDYGPDPEIDMLTREEADRARAGLPIWPKR